MIYRAVGIFAVRCRGKRCVHLYVRALIEFISALSPETTRGTRQSVFHLRFETRSTFFVFVSRQRGDAAKISYSFHVVRNKIHLCMSSFATFQIRKYFYTCRPRMRFQQFYDMILGHAVHRSLDAHARLYRTRVSPITLLDENRSALIYKSRVCCR